MDLLLFVCYCLCHFPLVRLFGHLFIYRRLRISRCYGFFLKRVIHTILPNLMLNSSIVNGENEKRKASGTMNEWAEVLLVASLSEKEDTATF